MSFSTRKDIYPQHEISISLDSLNTYIFRYILHRLVPADHKICRLILVDQIQFAKINPREY